MNKLVSVGVVLAVALAMVGCEKVENAGRQAARKAGSVVGKGTTEFFSGVGEGIKTVSDGNVPDVLTAIATRKSVRKFDPLRAVEDEKVEKILKAAKSASRSCVRSSRFPMATHRLTSSRSAIRRKIRR